MMSDLCTDGMQNKEQLQQRVKGARGLSLKRLLAPLVGQGVPKARHPKRAMAQAQSITNVRAVGSISGLVGADLGARQTSAGLKDRVSKCSQRKDAEYVRYLESAHRYY